MRDKQRTIPQLALCSLIAVSASGTIQAARGDPEHTEFCVAASRAEPSAAETQDVPSREVLTASHAYETARLNGSPIEDWLSDQYIRISQGGGLSRKAAAAQGARHRDIGLSVSKERKVMAYGAGIAVVLAETGVEGAPGPVRRLFLWAHEPGGWKLLAEQTTFIEPDGWTRSSGPVPESMPQGALGVEEQWLADAAVRLADPASAITNAELMANDAIVVDERGRLHTKESWIDAQFRNRAERRRVITEHVMVLGDAARVVGQLRDMTSSTRAIRFTHVWIRAGGAWQMAVSQSSPIGW